MKLCFAGSALFASSWRKGRRACSFSGERSNSDSIAPMREHFNTDPRRLLIPCNDGGSASGPTSALNLGGGCLCVVEMDSVPHPVSCSLPRNVDALLARRSGLPKFRIDSLLCCLSLVPKEARSAS
mmetsp:Transcript_8829/g.17124  ORF Transcript_8829/g.17124 Transcript_8829/m.17124 type:complete len:126 (+) Transcript_8829:1768-2145(+)